MRDFSTILMASLFVLFSLIVLISAASTPDRTSSTLDNDQQRVSDLRLRFAFKNRVKLRFFTLNDPFWWAMRRPDQRDFESGLNRRLSCAQL